MPFGIAPELLTGGFSAAFGLAFIVSELREFSQAWAAEEWPTVEGAIEETGVLTDPGGRYTTYYPTVRYHYEVKGHRYVSDRLWFGGTGSLSIRGWATTIADKYDAQREVTVYVSPTDPRVAVLEPGTHWGGWMILCMGILFLGLGITGLLTYWGVVTTPIHFR